MFAFSEEANTAVVTPMLVWVDYRAALLYGASKRYVPGRRLRIVEMGRLNRIGMGPDTDLDAILGTETFRSVP